MPVKRYHILIIEDSPSDRRIYRRFLESQRPGSFEITEAQTGRDGLKVCAAAPPDLIILDFKLPDRDGLGLIPELQQVTAAPIIFVTGQPEALVVSEAYRRGAERYLSKDFITAQALGEAVMSALGEAT